VRSDKVISSLLKIDMSSVLSLHYPLSPTGHRSLALRRAHKFMKSAILGGWLESDGPPKPEAHDNNCGGNCQIPIEDERWNNIDFETGVHGAEERSAKYILLLISKSVKLESGERGVLAYSNSRARKKKKCENGDGFDRFAAPLSCLAYFLLSEMKSLRRISTLI